MGALGQDLRYAFRQLRKNPGFTAVAVVTLALGIGANTAIFSLLNAVMLRRLPVREPQQLILFGKGEWIGSVNGLPNRSWQLFSYPFFRQFRQENQSFSDVAAVSSILFSTHGRVSGGANLERIDVELVSGSYFNTLGAGPSLGRVLSESDDQTPGAHPVAVASYEWWRKRFGRSPSVLGQTIKIGSTLYTVIGVAPSEFFGVTVGQSPDVWIPLAMEKQISPGWNGLEDKLFQSLYIIGRRKPEISISQASANTNALFKQILQVYAGQQPDSKTLEDIRHAQIELTPVATGLSQLRHEFSLPLKILMAVVALVLLVACANIANLLLARATARQREIAVRMSMGAGRVRLMKQLLLESFILALAGALAGIWLAWWGTQALLRMASTGTTTIPLQVTPDIQALLFTFTIATVTTLIFGVAPAWHATRVELAPSLKEGRGSISSHSHRRLARALIVCQIALSLLLLVGTGLFLRSLKNLTNVDTGFNKKNVLMTSLDFVAAGYRANAHLESVMQNIEERVNAVPGVKGSSFAFFVFNSGAWTTNVAVPGHEKSDKDGIVNHNIVGQDYFEAMGMPIVLGRSLTPQDTATSAKVAVINETMARTYFGGQNPIGRTFSVGDKNKLEKQTPEWLNLEVVGVVKDAKYQGLDEDQIAAAFYPHSQHPGFLYTFVARYDGDSKWVAPAITKAIAEIDPNLPVGEFSTLSQLVDDSVVDRRLVADLCAFFGVLAASLACIGIYGLMSYGVTRRTSEFGIRIALGAEGVHVLWLVLGETLKLAVLGMAVGLGLSVVCGRLIASFLYGLKSYDPTSISLAIFAMGCVALFAGYLPARRATKIDPTVALRYE